MAVAGLVHWILPRNMNWESCFSPEHLLYRLNWGAIWVQSRYGNFIFSWHNRNSRVIWCVETRCPAVTVLGCFQLGRRIPFRGMAPWRWIAFQIPRSAVSYLKKMVDDMVRHTKQISVCRFLTTSLLLLSVAWLFFGYNYLIGTSWYWNYFSLWQHHLSNCSCSRLPDDSSEW